MITYKLQTDGRATSTGVLMRQVVEKYYQDMAPFASLSLLQMFDRIKNLPYRPDPDKVETLMRPRYTMNMQGSGGDCLSEDTLLETRTEYVIISRIKPGDIIMGREGWTTVVSVSYKGILPVNQYSLSSGGRFFATKDHRCILSDGAEIKAGKLKIGDSLLKNDYHPCENDISVVSIEKRGRRKVYDLETSDHGIYLPGAGIVVHNCDDKSIALAAYARLYSIPYRFVAIRRPGRKNLHHVATELYINGKWLFADPTYRFNTLGRTREEAERVYI